MIDKTRQVAMLLVVCCVSWAAAGETDFAQAHKVLTKYCGGCHNDKEPTSEFSVQSYKSLLAGGDEGPAYVSGKSTDSRMIQMMRGDEPVMPPEDDPDLPRPSEKEIAIVANWIDAGAAKSTF